jgi:hypothetical protein
MMEAATWKPRRVYCTTSPDHSDQPGILCVVKFCQGKRGAAAMVSEVLCRRLFEAGGISVLNALIVLVSENFSASWNETPDMPFPIIPGEYFGTIHRGDLAAGPPVALNQVKQPQEIVDIWVFDSWVCNLDRDTEGNVLMQPARDNSFRLVAADQSDCFCGSLVFSSGEWKDRMVNRLSSNNRFVTDAIAYTGGDRSVRAAIDRARRAFEDIDSALNQVPGEWWNNSAIDPEEVRQVLGGRLARLNQVTNVGQWGDVDYGQHERDAQL